MKVVLQPETETNDNLLSPHCASSVSYESSSEVVRCATFLYIMAEIKFTGEEDEFLIDSVAKNPPLFDSQVESYKDVIVRENIWKDIAGKMNRSGKFKFYFQSITFKIYKLMNKYLH